MDKQVELDKFLSDKDHWLDMDLLLDMGHLLSDKDLMLGMDHQSDMVHKSGMVLLLLDKEHKLDKDRLLDRDLMLDRHLSDKDLQSGRPGRLVHRLASDLDLWLAVVVSNYHKFLFLDRQSNLLHYLQGVPV